MTTKHSTSRQELMSLIDYDGETGVFLWKVRRRGRGGGVRPGDRAGTLDKHGYRRIRINGFSYAEHQLALLFTTGDWPKSDVDHVNCDKADNRIANLRVVSRSINKQNLRGAHKSNPTGLLGVSQHKDSKRYRAVIGLPNGVQKHIGTFDTPEEAHAAYLDIKRREHEGCTL